MSFDGSSKLKAALLMERWVKEEKENEKSVLCKKKTSVTEHNLVVGLGLLLNTCWDTSGYFYCLTDAKISFVAPHVNTS